MRKETDGELFWKITVGKKPMPGYGTRLSPTDRWNVINYLRTPAKEMLRKRLIRDRITIRFLKLLSIGGIGITDCRRRHLRSENKSRHSFGNRSRITELGKPMFQRSLKHDRKSKQHVACEFSSIRSYLPQQ